MLSSGPDFISLFFGHAIRLTADAPSASRVLRFSRWLLVRKTWIAAARFIGIGWYISLCIVGGFFLGRWIGREFQIEVFGSLLGLAVGIVLAAYGIYAGYSLLNRNGVNNDRQERR